LSLSPSSQQHQSRSCPHPRFCKITTTATTSTESLFLSTVYGSSLLRATTTTETTITDEDGCNNGNIHGDQPNMSTNAVDVSEDEKFESSPLSFRIRKINFSELDQVSKIILVSFYKEEFQKGPWKHLCSMNELSRLQSNFPYSDPNHYMYAAVAESSKSSAASPSARRTLKNSNNNNNAKPMIVGFVDIDGRPPKQVTDPPRPYLSDLCIHPQWRRKGIARALIQKCEQTVQEQMNKSEMYIRVEQSNDAARSMYDGLGYSHQEHDIFGVRDTTMLLHRSFLENEGSNDYNDEGGQQQQQQDNDSSSVAIGITNDTVPVVDYVV